MSLSSSSEPAVAAATSPTPTTTASSKAPSSKKVNPLQHLIAGGCAGLVESSVCHPLDTIKTRMQLRKNQVESVERKIQHSLVDPVLRLRHSLQDATAVVGQHALKASSVTPTLHEPAAAMTASLRGLPPPFQASSKVVVLSQQLPRGTTVASLGPIGTAQRIIQREGFLALYKGLTAVYMGIVPKMAIRFVSFEQYKDILNDYTPMGRSTSATFTAGLLSGLTEAVLVVTPAEVCKVSRIYIRTSVYGSLKKAYALLLQYPILTRHVSCMVMFSNFYLGCTDSHAIATSFLD
jgi:hypothetical protein